MQEVSNAFGETCLVPFFHVGVLTLPPPLPRKWTLSKVNYLTCPMCKKPTCDASQKGSKRQNWVTFFWLVENYIHFSYPKCDRVVKGSEIDKFGEDEKCSTRTCNQCTTYPWVMCIWSICDSSNTHEPSITDPWFIWNPYVAKFDLHVTYLWPTFNINRNLCMIYLWPICNLSSNPCDTHLWLVLCDLCEIHL